MTYIEQMTDIEWYNEVLKMSGYPNDSREYIYLELMIYDLTINCTNEQFEYLGVFNAINEKYFTNKLIKNLLLIYPEITSCIGFNDYHCMKIEEYYNKDELRKSDIILNTFKSARNELKTEFAENKYDNYLPKFEKQINWIKEKLKNTNIDEQLNCRKI